MKSTSLPYSSWIFIVTILWIGFLLAISFMEAPLKFKAPSLTLPVALEIGYIVFHALNIVEIIFGGLIIAAGCFGQASRRTLLFIFGVMATLITQTIILFTRLDAQTLAAINGLETSSTPYHIVYMRLEIVKLVALLALAFSQLSDFKSLVAKSAIQDIKKPSPAP